MSFNRNNSNIGRMTDTLNKVTEDFDNMIFETEPSYKIECLFDGWEETMIWSCLQNIMGHLYSDDTENPKSVMAEVGDFCFLAGKPNEEMVKFKSKYRNDKFTIMIPQNEIWARIIEKCYSLRAKRVIRYAMKKEKDIFDKNRLQDIVEGLNSLYSIEMIDERLFNYCRNTKWCCDFVSQYDSYERYKEYGMGVMISKGGEYISGASSYAGYRNGIEIEVDTKEGYRRRGLASVCSAKLILECLKKGWYPSWDAQNLWSAALAKKLGYNFSHKYVAYEITDK